MSHTLPLMAFFYSVDGLATFKSFLRSEFSDENIEFWEACEDFKKTKSPMKMTTKAKKIYEDFIQTGGPKEVCLLFSYSPKHGPGSQITDNVSESCYCNFLLMYCENMFNKVCLDECINAEAHVLPFKGPRGAMKRLYSNGISMG